MTQNEFLIGILFVVVVVLFAPVMLYRLVKFSVKAYLDALAEWTPTKRRK